MPYRAILTRLLANAERRGIDKEVARLERELHQPPLPGQFAHIFEIWQRLRRRKGNGGFGLSPWEWPDLAAMFASTDTYLTPWEVKILEKLDDIFLAEYAQRRAEAAPETPGPGGK